MPFMYDRLYLYVLGSACMLAVVACIILTFACLADPLMGKLVPGMALAITLDALAVVLPCSCLQLGLKGGPEGSPERTLTTAGRQ